MASPGIVRQFDSSAVRQFPGGPAGGTPERPNAGTPEQSGVTALAARAALARALALAFAPPQGPALDFLMGGLAPKVMEAAVHLADGPALRAGAEAVARALEDGPDLDGEYHRLFRTELAATPYETEYGPHRAARKGAELADILGFYEAFGFRPAPSAAELPDHIGAELEFLSLLLVKEADARGRGAAEEAAVAADAARKFFADHLGRWARAFCQRLRDATRHQFYAAAAGLLQGFLDAEASRLGCPLGEAGLPASGSPADCVACPMALQVPPGTDRASGGVFGWP